MAANGGVGRPTRLDSPASLITASFQLGARWGLQSLSRSPRAVPTSTSRTHTQPSEALTLGFQRGLLGASIALVIAAVIALRAPNVRVADMAQGADDEQAAPVPVYRVIDTRSTAFPNRLSRNSPGIEPRRRRDGYSGTSAKTTTKT